LGLDVCGFGDGLWDVGYVVVCRGEGADKLQRARAKDMKSSEREDWMMSKQ
jgi:hypothetical protein